MRLGERLRELRVEHGYTLRELRQKLEETAGERVSISYLSEVERDQAMPTLATLTNLAHIFGMSTLDLLDPVDIFDESRSEARYPQSLRDFQWEKGLSDEWVETLARVEHRGQRPETPLEWDAIYSILKAFLEPKAARDE